MVKGRPNKYNQSSDNKRYGDKQLGERISRKQKMNKQKITHIINHQEEDTKLRQQIIQNNQLIWNLLKQIIQQYKGLDQEQVEASIYILQKAADKYLIETFDMGRYQKYD